ncbi:MAG TPA: FUSC family protein [Streptosporangiaceae bacterium]
MPAAPALRDALRIDRSGLRPVLALKATAGVALPLIAGIAVGQPAAGATASFGALSVGVAVLTAGPRTPAGTMLAASVGMGAASFIGSLSGLVPPVHLVVLAAAGFLAGLLVAAGPGATQVGINAMIALLVFGRNAAGPEIAALHATWVMAGGLVQTGLAILIRSPRPLQTQREALATGYEALAGTATEPPSLLMAEAVATARDAIGPRLANVRRPEAEPLLGLADELERIRQELHALHFHRSELTANAEDREPISEALDLTSQALLMIATGLRTARPADGVEPVAAKLLSLADELDPGRPAASPSPAPSPSPAASPSRPAARFASLRIVALAGQLRAAGRMTARLTGTRRLHLPLSAGYAADPIIVLPGQLRSALRQVRAAASPSSPAFRHGIRLAVVIPLATELARLLPLQRGYWLAVTTVIVLKPDYTATVSRGIARMIGTGAGLIAAAVIVTTTHPDGAVLIALVTVCSWLGYTVFVASYASYAAFLTALVILLVSAAQRSAISPVTNRGVDTLIGGLIAIAAYLVWPTWEAKTLRAATAERFDAAARFLLAVLEVYLEPKAYDRGALARLAAATRRAQSTVTASLERARGEPARIRPDVSGYASALAAARRIVAGTHSLASHLNDAKAQVAVPAAAVIVGQTGDAMAELVRSVRAGLPPGPLPDLRQSQRELAAQFGSGTTQADRRGAILAALFDPLIDSINTAAHVLTDLPYQAPRSPGMKLAGVMSALMPQTSDQASEPQASEPQASKPQGRSAHVHILQDGYVRSAEDGEHVGSTVTLITDGDAVVVVDPGLVSSREALLAALASHHVTPQAVTDVVFSHHHPDHTVNAALFPAAKIHDHWAVYEGDLWHSREAEGTSLSPSILLLATPGHTPQDISTVASTADGIYVCTHAWWAADGPAEDPFSLDQAALSASRQRILEIATVIIPGHGPSFTPGEDTPR